MGNYSPKDATDPHYFRKIGGMPIPHEVVEAAEQMEGGKVVTDVLLLANLNLTLDQIYLRYREMPAVVELPDHPFFWFIPKQIEFDGPNPPALITAKPYGMVGWVQVPKKITIGGISK